MNSSTQDMTLDEKARIYAQNFVNRWDVHARQWGDPDDHGYRVVRGSYGLDLVKDHLQGTRTLAFHALSGQSTAKWMAIDADTTVVDELERILERFNSLDLPEPLLEWSGRRGYHYLLLFSHPVPGWKAKRLGETITDRHEVFPKQETVSSDTSSPGSVLKGPLSLHLGSSGDGWSVFVDSNFQKIDRPFEWLQARPWVEIEEFDHLFEKPDDRNPRSSGVCRVKVLRPCLAKAMAEGVEQGRRNEVAHLVCAELRRLGRSKQEAAGALACMNLRNQPPLPKRELATVIRSCYGDDPYFYSCRRGGHLRRVLSDYCVGAKKCRYMEAVRRRKHEKATNERKAG